MVTPRLVIPRCPRPHGFSLIELVIVIVIIGVIAAVAIPRVSRGASNAETHAAKASLRAVRQAIDMHKAERNAYPSSSLEADFIRDLTQHEPMSNTGPYLVAIPSITLSRYCIPAPLNTVGFGTDRGNYAGTATQADFAWCFSANGILWINASAQQVRDW